MKLFSYYFVTLFEQKCYYVHLVSLGEQQYDCFHASVSLDVNVEMG